MQQYERYTKVLMDSRGKIIEVPLRCGKGDTAFIDAISFTFHQSTVARNFDVPFYMPEDVIRHLSVELLSIFGFSISHKAKGTGGRFYEQCWEMSADGVMFGRVHIGGQQDTVLVEVLGKGCEVARDGWEARLHTFLSGAHRAKITRCDVAKDFFNREITPESAYQAWQDGQFSKRGKRPIIDRYGSDWDCDTQKGKTLYVGSRDSGIFARIYDKAKQQGDKVTDWTRFELQFQGRNVKIDLDILLVPGEFFGGAFPICAELQKCGKAVRTLARDKRFHINIEVMKLNLKKQCGRRLNALIALGMSALDIIKDLRNDEGLLPQNLNPVGFDLDFCFEKWVHQQERQKPLYADLF